MDAAIRAGVILLALLRCVDDDRAASSGGPQRRCINRPQVTYSDNQMIVRIWNPRQIGTLARDFDRYKNATQLKFHFSGTTDEQFAAVPALPLVEVVRISEEPAITDKSLRVLARFPKLWELDLGGTAITGKGFQYFAGEKGKKQRGPALKKLTLAGNNLTDEGLRELARITTLSRLYVFCESAITAQGVLEHLPKLKQPLNLVIAYDEKHRWITDQDREELHKRMPNCEIRYGVYRGKREKIQYEIGSGDPFAVAEEGQKGTEPSSDEKKD